MLRLAAQQFLQCLSSLVLLVQKDVQLGQIEIGLIGGWGHAEAGLEFLFSPAVLPLTHEKDAQVIQYFRGIGSQFCGTFEVFLRLRQLVLPRMEHAHAVHCVGVVRFRLECPLQKFLRFLESPLVTLEVPQIDESGNVARPQSERLLEILNGLFLVSLLRRNHA